MNASSSIRDIFFEEAEDLLKELSQSLNAIAQGARDPETLNVVFRAVHSLKGGGAAFGFDDLVGFAHTYEVLLNQLRTGTRELDQDVLRLLSPSGDVLSDLVTAVRTANDVNAEKVNAASSALEAVLGDAAIAEEEFTFEAIAGDFDFDLEPIPVGVGPRTFKITFEPWRELYSAGHEPLVLIRALQDLGQTTVSANLSKLPDFENFDREDSYFKWNISLFTEESEHDVREIFEFVDGLCHLAIRIEKPEPSTRTMKDDAQ